MRICIFHCPIIRQIVANADISTDGCTVIFPCFRHRHSPTLYTLTPSDYTFWWMSPVALTLTHQRTIPATLVTLIWFLHSCARNNVPLTNTYLVEYVTTKTYADNGTTDFPRYRHRLNVHRFHGSHKMRHFHGNQIFSTEKPWRILSTDHTNTVTDTFCT